MIAFDAFIEVHQIQADPDLVGLLNNYHSQYLGSFLSDLG